MEWLSNILETVLINFVTLSSQSVHVTFGKKSSTETILISSFSLSNTGDEQVLVQAICSIKLLSGLR